MRPPSQKLSICANRNCTSGRLHNSHMFKPYACVACERIIFDQDFIASLISLFNSVVVEIPVDAEIPKNGVASKEWAVYSAWDGEPGDEGQANLLCTQIFYPDGNPFGETAKIKMGVELGKRSQIKTQIHGFPIGEPGSYIVRTWVEQNEKSASPVIEFKIDLEIKRQPKLA